MTTRTRTAVVLDIGCTLIHPDVDVLRDLLAATGPAHRHVDADLEAAFRYACEANLRRLPDAPAVSRRGMAFLAALGEPVSAARGEALWTLVDEHGGSDGGLYTRLDDAAHEVLSALRSDGHLVVAASNSDGTLSEELASFGLDAHFDLLFDSHDLGVEKPSAAFFRHVLTAVASRHDLARTWYVGDDPVRDGLGALYGGFDRAVLYDPFGIYRSIDADARIESLSRLPELVRADG